MWRREGHLFTTIWIPGVKLKELDLVVARIQRCPVGQHWSLVVPVREADLTDADGISRRNTTMSGFPDSGVLLSVAARRGSWWPGLCRGRGHDRVVAGIQAEAVRATAGALDRLTADLAAHGGVALEADTERHPLTWSAHSAATMPSALTTKDRASQLTGQVTAEVAVMIAVRAFELLDPLGAVLAADEAVSVHQVGWHVDWDNPAWPDVRASAIQAAIARGRDYAAALGGSLRSVDT